MYWFHSHILSKENYTEWNDNATGYDGAVMMMGDKIVELQDENNLKVVGTPRFWCLINEKKHKDYINQYRNAYKKLMIQTKYIKRMIQLVEE